MRCESSSPGSGPSASGTRATCARSTASDLELLAFRQRRLPHVVTESLQRDDTRNVETELAVTVFEKLDAALAARPDAVFVCTPSSQPLDIAQRAADAGCHLFIEKPVSHTLEGRPSSATRSRRSNSSCSSAASGGITRACGGCEKCFRRERSGRLPVRRSNTASICRTGIRTRTTARRTPRRADLGGGVVLTQIHDYDLAWWLFGAPRTVSATGGHLSDLEIDVEDTVDARFAGGAVPVSIRQSLASRPPRRTLRVTASRAR